VWQKVRVALEEGMLKLQLGQDATVEHPIRVKEPKAVPNPFPAVVGILHLGQEAIVGHLIHVMEPKAVPTPFQAIIRYLHLGQEAIV